MSCFGGEVDIGQIIIRDYVWGMKTPRCPNCFKPPEISFKSRIVLPTKNGIPCNNCQTLLIPSNWDGLTILFPIFITYIIFGFPPRQLSGYNLGLFCISFLIVGVISAYLTATFAPLKVKSDLKENKWLFALIVLTAIPAICLISFLIYIKI